MVESTNKTGENAELPDYDVVYELFDPDAQDGGAAGAQGAEKGGNP